MDHLIKNITQKQIERISQYRELPIIPFEVNPITKNPHKQYCISTIYVLEEVWTFIIEFFIADYECTIKVLAAKFETDDFKPYSGVEDLQAEILNIQNYPIYYLQSLASDAVINYIEQGMGDDFTKEFFNKYKK